MDYGLLLRSIAKYIKLDKHEEEYLLPLLFSKKVKANEVLVEAGDINSRVMFVTSGCLRSYVLDAEGVEHNLQFAPEEYWIVDLLSFIKEEPTRLYIDALIDTEIIYLMKSDFDTVYLQIPKIERFGRILAMNGLASFQHRQIDNVILNPEERYAKFCESYPSLTEELDLPQIASYIGVSNAVLNEILNTESLDL